MIALSLRHFFPEHWDGVSDTYSIAQHVDDVIGFIEKLDTGPVDLMGHSRGGHVSFRVAQRRPDLLRKLILAEPGGELDATLDPEFKAGPLAARWRGSRHRPKRSRPAISMADWHFSWMRWKAPARWNRLPATPKQLLRDNAMTLIGQVRDNRPPFSKGRCGSDQDADAVHRRRQHQGCMLPKVLHTLAAHVAGSKTAMIPGTTHPMFEQAPQKYCEIVLEFLAGG